ncbi:tetraspanin-33-like [Dendronephthya gigantea]|uniref:tetraspanin-33-like n=1 Tax=Dendronephthya gigantea TaxID=151771 RepID=UPI00106B704C|nr:tetraspanin-33-like [Dendronephthya gigantea]
MPASTRRVQVAPAQNGAERSHKEPSHPRHELRTSRCVKYTMFFKNMFFLLCGVFVGAIGIIALQEKGKLHGQFDGLFLDPAAIMLSVGIVIFVVSFCGALGALRENKCLLRFFYACLILIILLQLSIGLAAYFAKNTIKGKIDNVFQKAIVEYQDDPDLQSLIDYIQFELKCCGSTEPKDWNSNPYFKCNNESISGTSDIGSACSVPHSCCSTDKLNRMCGFGVFTKKGEIEGREKKIYTTGCLEALETWFKDHVMYAGIVCGVLLVLQAISVKLAFRMISDIDEIIKYRDR